MSVWSRIAESKIAEAHDRGEFASLSGAGQPLRFERHSGPPEWRMANKILKNAGVVPEEVTLRAELAKLERIVERIHEDDPERARLTRRLLDERLRYDLMMERRRR